jgi:dTDP-4-dehydrorhamnose 3,5-epimerase
MMRPLSIEPAWRHEPKVHHDPRGDFHEWFRAPDFRAATGHDFHLAQANLSVSARGTLRGIHFAQVPPGQAKYIQCVRGAILDVIVDVRTGSPTYGQWTAERLDADNRHALYLGEGLGHGFMALTDDAAVSYLCSEGYRPEREFGIDPFDPDLGIEWPKDIEPLLSERDATAPGLEETRRMGLLPTYEECQAYYARLRTR